MPDAMTFDEYYKKKQDESVVVPEPQTAAEALPPVAADSEAATPAKPVDMKWWKSPGYVAAEKRLQEDGKRLMQQQEKQQQRNRNAAIVGDIARLMGQNSVKRGGGWMIDKTASAADTENTRLQQLRENNAARMLQFAERMAQAKERERADEMNKEKTRMSLQQAADNAAADYALKKAQTDAEIAYNNRKFDETERHNKAMEKAASTRADAYATGQRTRAVNGGSSGPFIDVWSSDGQKHRFSKAQYGDTYLNDAYEAGVALGYPALLVVVEDENGSKSAVPYNPRVHKISTNQLKAWISNWNHGGAQDYDNDEDSSTGEENWNLD